MFSYTSRVRTAVYVTLIAFELSKASHVNARHNYKIITVD